MNVLRVWNLRRGDADDDLWSPYAGGLHRLFVAAVFEFNLKAPVGFFLLIILPALVIGIAPSLVATFGHLVFHTTTLAGTNLVLTIILVVGGSLRVDSSRLKRRQPLLAHKRHRRCESLAAEKTEVGVAELSPQLVVDHSAASFSG